MENNTINSYFLQKQFLKKLKRNKYDFYYENVFLFERESDIISFRNGTIHEYEFKISERDFRRDIHKKRHKKNKPHYFYYVVSSENIINGDYLPYAGIYVHYFLKNGFSKFKLIKEPQLIRTSDIDVYEMYSLLKIICHGKAIY